MCVCATDLESFGPQIGARRDVRAKALQLDVLLVARLAVLVAEALKVRRRLAVGGVRVRVLDEGEGVAVLDVLGVFPLDDVETRTVLRVGGLLH